jgi:hypothetical protein
MDQTLPQNYMVIVDTKVGSASAFNAALNMISTLHHERSLKPNKLFIVHMSNIKQNYWGGKGKSQENLNKQEKCCKCVLSYYGKRAEVFEIPYMLIGCYCNDRNEYESKISFLVNRFEITGIFLGNLKFHLPLDIRANVFHVNRVMGFIPDSAYLKDTIHGEDISNFKSLDETRGRDGGLKTKVGSDFMEYRWLEQPRFTEVEKALLQNEILGVGYPHELPKVESKATESTLKVEPVVAKTDSSQKESSHKGESVEEKRPEVSPEQPSQLETDHLSVSHGTLPPPITSQRTQQQPQQQQQQQPAQFSSSGRTTVATGESGAAAMTSQPTGMPVEKSLEEMEKDLDVMEQQLRKLNPAEHGQQQTAIV